MTENETIDKLNNLHYKIVHTSFCNKVYESEIEALCMAKDCLKEIQQYKAIGTVDEVAEMENSYINYFHKARQYEAIGTVEEFRKLRKMFGDDFPEMSEVVKRILKEYPEYQSIGTVDELKALKEKSVAKKVIVYGQGQEASCYCPNCKAYLGCDGDWYYDQTKYCNECGQAFEEY